MVQKHFLNTIKKIKQAETLTDEEVTNNIEDFSAPIIEFEADEYALSLNSLYLIDNTEPPMSLIEALEKNTKNITNVYKVSQLSINLIINASKEKLSNIDQYSSVQELFFSIIAEAVKRDVSDVFFVHNPENKTGVVKFREFGEIQTFKYIDLDLLNYTFPAVYNLCQGTSSIYSILEYQAGSIQGNDIPKYLQDQVSGLRLQYNPIHPQPARQLVCRIMRKSDKTTTLSLEGLGFNKQQEDMLLTSPKGLSIFSGPTGSGKSTALRAILQDFINQSANKKIIYSIEDPIEVEMPDIIQLTISNAKTEEEQHEKFLDAMRALTRSDMDFCVIGEIRSKIAASYAYQLATSGHPIMSTFHAGDASMIPSRLRALGLPDYQVFDPSILSKLVSQRLIPILCDKCKIKTTPQKLSTHIRGNFTDRLKLELKDKEATLYSRGKGCSHCQGKGIIGRTVIAEVIETNQEFFSIYSSQDSMHAREYWLNEMNGFDMRQHALEKILAGNVDTLDVIKGDVLGETQWI